MKLSKDYYKALKEAWVKWHTDAGLDESEVPGFVNISFEHGFKLCWTMNVDKTSNK